jgi:hypothetical protein
MYQEALQLQLYLQQKSGVARSQGRLRWWSSSFQTMQQIKIVLFVCLGARSTHGWRLETGDGEAKNFKLQAG